MKTKRLLVHIEDPGRFLGRFEDLKCYLAYCGRWSVPVLEPWEKAQSMTPLCKTCLRVMDLRQQQGVIEMDGNSE